MWEGNYGREPFDLRLTVLRFLRNLGKIIVLTLLGTFLFGGGYYVKNVWLGPPAQYSVTSVYKVDYVNPPTETGDYYINEMTWNTLVQSDAFLTYVQAALQKPEWSLAQLAEVISAKLPSDWNIPTVTVITDSPEEAMEIALAVQAAMEKGLTDIVKETAGISTLDMPSEAQEVAEDVRPLRAVVLSALLSFFFAAVLFLLKELGEDGIWLPSTLRRRYGLKVLGTMKSPELDENIQYLFQNRNRIAVCSVDSRVDVCEVTESLEGKGKQWLPMPPPLLCLESCAELRRADGILLVVQAGGHAGKPLEYVLEYLAQQECEVTAVLLWNADEALIKAYYGIFNKL